MTNTTKSPIFSTFTTNSGIATLSQTWLWRSPTLSSPSGLSQPPPPLPLSPCRRHLPPLDTAALGSKVPYRTSLGYSAPVPHKPYAPSTKIHNHVRPRECEGLGSSKQQLSRGLSWYLRDSGMSIPALPILLTPLPHLTSPSPSPSLQCAGLHHADMAGSCSRALKEKLRFALARAFPCPSPYPSFEYVSSAEKQYTPMPTASRSDIWAPLAARRRTWLARSNFSSAALPERKLRG